MKIAKWLLSWTVCCTIACLNIHAAATLYVWTNSPSPASPFTNWATAAHTIQAAVDAASAGDTVLVTNGTYATGEIGSAPAHRVAIEKPIRVLSVNGPAVTIIQGDYGVRCAYLGRNAVLSGFTLTGAGLIIIGPGGGFLPFGAGVYCSDSTAVVTNCTLTGNGANVGGGAYKGTLIDCSLSGNVTYDEGGGAVGATLYHCTLSNNATTLGGGAYYCSLNNCTLTGNSAGSGGGAADSTLNNCTLIGNSASATELGRGGGGATDSTLNNCILTGNRSANYGGGAANSTLNNCTITGNSAPRGGGVAYATLNNCILHSNSAPGAYDWGDQTVMSFCCIWSDYPVGIGNITNDPGFVSLADQDVHLGANSPCINAGDNTYATNVTDLDGNPRVVSGAVDIGAYEYQGTGSTISYAWLQQYGLPTDGSADLADPDGDGLNNWQEWQADTDPEDGASLLHLTMLSNAPPLVVSFSSSTARVYTLLCCTNLSTSAGQSTWTPVPGQTNIVGNGDKLTLTDTNPPGSAFYRVSVRFP
jgi:hypothetical protein